MGRHTRSIPIVQSDHDRVILLLATKVDALLCEQIASFVRTDEEVQKDIKEIIDDAWAEVRGDNA